MIQTYLLAPFELGFMRRALAGCLALSLAAPPLGVFLVLRRMSLTSDVLQHGILPGLALGAMVGSFSIFYMGLGGILAGLTVTWLAGLLARRPAAREDSQLAALYLIALALGVALISGQHGIDLTHLLFGSVLAVDDTALALMAGVSAIALIGLAFIWRPLVFETLDPGYLSRSPVIHLTFLTLVVACVVGGFTAMGTLMSVGLMMLPAISARHWAQRLPGQVRAAVLLAIIASIVGLLLSFHLDLPTGPAIILTAGALWTGSLIFGRYEHIRTAVPPR